MPTTRLIKPTSPACDALPAPKLHAGLDAARDTHRAAELVAFGVTELARLLGSHAARRDLARSRQLGLGTLDVAVVLGIQAIAVIIWVLLSRLWAG